ncbi:quinone-dependent dihydroorotate dehydrogenase [Synechococcus sp. PCC 6312]|uniref:quinone-dependent dihydroorotate dehydrogenase n=1 Tax=Synechococcus sp. (strain ATCC 27167 / PCC 6312) TaxID=195253 RepID=UPI00029EFACF|nr:quinone-dependent dihydroorotate dehydrogenase [Synechococcus sp. PCC 6312]AFY60261.1 dihydroorotate oxidase A [Synechococcus sp. PCC 6312]
MNLYTNILRPFVFSGLRADPEAVHHQLLRVCGQIEAWGEKGQWLRQLCRSQYQYSAPKLSQKLWGLSFPNPLGLAPGFDKDGLASSFWQELGFGFVEVGTVTWQAQGGNPKPRLFRLPADLAGLNRMGFNNLGAVAMARTLEQSAAEGLRTVPIGINLGKSKVTPLEQAVADYVQSFQVLQPWGDYFVVNVSSPNTPGLRTLQSRSQLEPILAGLQASNHLSKPLLIKVAPDLAWSDLDEILELAQAYQLAGIIATNTTLSRHGLKTTVLPSTQEPIETAAGGLSGAPLRQKSTEMIRYIYRQTGGTLPIIGVGGVFNAAQAWEKICAGASLIQVYTGWVYEGPGMVKAILQGLEQYLGDQAWADVIGQDAKELPSS